MKIDELGTPDVKLGSLRIWVHGWERPDSDDYWDGNWLRATAICSKGGSQVLVSGSILRSNELREWLAGIERMNSTLLGEANLNCIEPELKVEMVCESLGGICVRVEITPDHLTQFHSIEFEVDQSYLPDIMSELKVLLTRFGIKGQP